VLFEVPRTASIRAIGTCYCLVLTRDALEYVLNRYPKIGERFKNVANQRMKDITRARRRKSERNAVMDIVAGNIFLLKLYIYILYLYNIIYISI